MTSTFRADTRRRLWELAVAYQATDATVLEVYRNRPKSFPNTPAIFVGRPSEALGHTQGIRQRRLTCPLVIVGWPVDNDEQDTTLGAIVDGVVDYVTANWDWIAGALIEPTGVEGVELAVGEEFHAAEAVNVLAQIQEPRT